MDKPENDPVLMILGKIRSQLGDVQKLVREEKQMLRQVLNREGECDAPDK